MQPQLALNSPLYASGGFVEIHVKTRLLQPSCEQKLPCASVVESNVANAGEVTGELDTSLVLRANAIAPKQANKVAQFQQNILPRARQRTRVL